MLPELAEREATGDVARIYAEIRALCAVPYVSSMQRHLATRPGWLEWAWAALRPVFADLPGPGGPSGFSTPESRRTAAGLAPRPRPTMLRWVVPVLMIALAITVITHLPFVLLALLVCWAILHRRGPRRGGYRWQDRHHYGWH